MANIEPAAYPLMLLYRLMRYSPSTDGVFLGHGTLDDPEDTFLVRRVELAHRFRAGAPHLFEVVSSGRWGSEHSLVFDSAAPKPTLAVLAAELRTSHARCGPLRGWPYAPGSTLRPFSDYELLASVIALGDVNGSYGSSYWGSEQEVLHLLACGINWKLFSGVGSVSWREWGGTFGEDSYETKLGTDLHCNCAEDRWEQDVSFGLTPPSLATLLSRLGAGKLGEIFDV